MTLHAPKDRHAPLRRTLLTLVLLGLVGGGAALGASSASAAPDAAPVAPIPYVSSPGRYVDGHVVASEVPTFAWDASHLDPEQVKRYDLVLHASDGSQVTDATTETSWTPSVPIGDRRHCLALTLVTTRGARVDAEEMACVFVDRRAPDVWFASPRAQHLHLADGHAIAIVNMPDVAAAMPGASQVLGHILVEVRATDGDGTPFPFGEASGLTRTMISEAGLLIGDDLIRPCQESPHDPSSCTWWDGSAGRATRVLSATTRDRAEHASSANATYLKVDLAVVARVTDDGLEGHVHWEPRPAEIYLADVVLAAAAPAAPLSSARVVAVVTDPATTHVVDTQPQPGETAFYKVVRLSRGPLGSIEQAATHEARITYADVDGLVSWPTTCLPGAACV